MIPNPRIREPRIPWNPPVYHCVRATAPFGQATGRLDRPFWEPGEWIEDFHDIEGPGRPRPAKETRVKMLWDEEALYVGALLHDDTIWATVTERDHVIFVDNDFEVFLAPQDSSHRYYELEINAHGTVWDLLMEKPQRDRVRRIIGWDIRGLDSAVHIEGRLNDPCADNRFWSLELKIPWFSLRECGVDQCWPERFAPLPGEVWRANFSRVQWRVHAEDGSYAKDLDPSTGLPLPEDNWVWAPTGVIDIHLPEMWGFLVFTKKGEDWPLPPDEDVKLALRRLYYRQHAHACREGGFTTDVERLMGEEAARYQMRAFVTPSLFEGIARGAEHCWHIRQDGCLWRGDLEP
ncbi:MAG: carbohydrate-binding family 9-like protein [Bacillota bacterium]|nr:carbohydrate-binding family 9-like protein [Bacillota bacterium]